MSLYWEKDLSLENGVSYFLCGFGVFSLMKYFLGSPQSVPNTHTHALGKYNLSSQVTYMYDASAANDNMGNNAVLGFIYCNLFGTSFILRMNNFIVMTALPETRGSVSLAIWVLAATWFQVFRF